MNHQHVKELTELAHWCRQETGLSVNFEIKIWSFKTYEEQETEYSFWIEDLFSQRTKDSLMLMTLIPYIKGLCHKQQLKGLAA
jgi:hypothetical protein